MREHDQKDLQPLAALMPRGAGHQFVAYADACSGVPGAPHEANLAAVNAIVRRLTPQPEFICFPGDEIQGLTADTAALRSQWRHWLDREMAWHDRRTIPLYHTTGNHTTYDAPARRSFAKCWPICRAMARPVKRGCPTGYGEATSSSSSSTPSGRARRRGPRRNGLAGQVLTAQPMRATSS